MKTISSIIISLFLTASVFAQTTTNISSKQESPVAAVKSSLDGSLFEIVGRADTDHIILQLNKETGEVKFLGNDKYIKIIRQESSDDVAEAGAKATTKRGGILGIVDRLTGGRYQNFPQRNSLDA